MPDNFYFYTEVDGGITINFNRKKAPKLEQVKSYYKALGYFIDQWDEEAIEEYNETIQKEWDEMQEGSYTTNEPKLPTPGLIYLLKCDGIYKIGRTKNLDKRLRKYVTENPHPIEIVHTRAVADYVLAEKKIHELVETLKVRGEWYKLTDLKAQLVTSEINKL